MSIKWTFREFWWGETAKAAVCGLIVVVQDCDGDRSWWEVRKGSTVLAEGEDHGHTPYHFEACRTAAEKSLRQIIAERVEALKAERAAHSPAKAEVC